MNLSSVFVAVAESIYTRLSSYGFELAVVPAKLLSKSPVSAVAIAQHGFIGALQSFSLHPINWSDARPINGGLQSRTRPEQRDADLELLTLRF